MTQQKKEELTEDFLSYMGVELADTVIADWWLNKFDQLIQEKVEKIEKLKRDYQLDDPWAFGRSSAETYKMQEIVDEAITILKE